jgi:hypothetical protein
MEVCAIPTVLSLVLINPRVQLYGRGAGGISDVVELKNLVMFTFLGFPRGCGWESVPLPAWDLRHARLMILASSGRP